MNFTYFLKAIIVRSIVYISVKPYCLKTVIVYSRISSQRYHMNDYTEKQIQTLFLETIGITVNEFTLIMKITKYIKII